MGRNAIKRVLPESTEATLCALGSQFVSMSDSLRQATELRAGLRGLS